MPSYRPRVSDFPNLMTCLKMIRYFLQIPNQYVSESKMVKWRRPTKQNTIILFITLNRNFSTRNSPWSWISKRKLRIPNDSPMPEQEVKSVVLYRLLAPYISTLWNFSFNDAWSRISGDPHQVLVKNPCVWAESESCSFIHFITHIVSTFYLCSAVLVQHALLFSGK